jgi:hypothetical protein
MSPEQASGKPVDHRTDQFAAGLILHEMATGRPLFRRDTPAQVLAAVIEREAEPLRRLRADVPPALEALVARCLRKDVEGRFTTTDELAAQLRALRDAAPAASAASLVVPSPAPAPVSAEVIVPRGDRSLYHVQHGRRIRTYSEERLSELLRRGKLAGVELVRRDDQEGWQPLFESEVYRRVVPTSGDPRADASLRVLQPLAGHLSGFLITGVVMMYTSHGHVPMWMGIWAAVIAAQALRTAPTAWALFQRRRALRESEAGRVVLPSPAPALVAAGVPSPLAHEASLVRTLIEQRGGSDVPRLLAEVDGILKLVADVTARVTDLEEQTSEKERAALAALVAETEARLGRADQAQDRRLLERQLKILRGREEAIAKAVRVLDRLRVRRELAEHQLKQLRLDLSRGAASGLDVPELSSRLQSIRYEVDAREDIEEMDARRG